MKFTGTYSMIPNGVIKRWHFISWSQVAVFEFCNDPVNPLTFWLDDYTWIQPGRHFDGCDFGSVPLCLQGLVSPLCAPRSFILHDYMYEFHGWWTKTGFVTICRKQADDLLYDMMRAEGCNKWTASKTWAGVRAGGWPVWPKDEITIQNMLRADRIAATNPPAVVGNVAEAATDALKGPPTP